MATIGRYATKSDENFEDFPVGLDRRLILRKGTSLTLGGSDNRLHEGAAPPTTSHCQAVR